MHFTSEMHSFHLYINKNHDNWSLGAVKKQSLSYFSNEENCAIIRYILCELLGDEGLWLF